MSIQEFQYGIKNIRIVIKNGDAWFVAKDVCDALEISNPTDAIKRLDEDERSRFNLGRQGESNIVSESGLYSLILGSRKPEAKIFKRWITHDVIPSIRKHGAYMTPETIERTLTNPDFIIQLATQLKDEQVKRLIAEEKIEADRPLVTFAETAMKSKDNILVRELSKIIQDEGINIGEKKLYSKFRDWGIILTQSREPSQRGMNQKLFVYDETPINTPYGVKLVKTTRVTPKGQIYIIEKLKKELKEAQ